MDKQDKVKEYITKIAKSNGLTYEEVKDNKLVTIVLEYIEDEGDNDND